MSGGIIQLVAYGRQDVFITDDPQITFFKVVYRRHTNFSVEPVPQKFNQTPNFSKRSTCVLTRRGDLIANTYLVIILPDISLKTENGNEIEAKEAKFAWVRKIGYALIKNIKIEIGGQLIDEQYGEWLNLWHELFGPREIGYDKMIGNVEELYCFSNTKDQYELFIPLNFWFCKTSGLALPLISLQYTDVVITLEMSDFDKCHILLPTNYIQIYSDLVNLEPYEYIEQDIDGKIASGIFTNFDIQTKRLYYIKTSQYEFQSINSETTNILDYSNQVFNIRSKKYFIKGMSSGYTVMPEFSSVAELAPVVEVENPNIIDGYLLVDYIYLDDEERIRFMKSKNDYLIEQVMYTNEQIADSPNRTVKLELLQPCKLLIWITQLSYIFNNNDFFNYTNNYKYCGKHQVGKSLIVKETILLNSLKRLELMEYQYFNYIQPYQHCTYSPSEGINIYSFSLFPEKMQPSGSCNMSQIDNVQIELHMDSIVSASNTVKFRAYALVYNVLRIVNGLAGLIFTV